ncbi:MAG: hypothetical protein IH612_04115 [Desulfofustis sp.]|nr:hypothetical protein [Desulfofustis sp.]
MKKIISTTTAFLFVASLGIVGSAAATSWNFKENYLDRSVTTVSDSKKSAPDRTMLTSSSDSGERHIVGWNFDEGIFSSGAEIFDSGSATDQIAAASNDDDGRLVSWNSDEGRFDSGATLRLPAEEQVTLSGTISNDNPVRWHSEEIAATDSVTFRAGSGNSFSLADNAQGLKLSDLDGRSVEIKGTVMERAGEKVIEVSDYNVLN